MKNISIKEVAQMANLSTATVSRVINGKGNVTDESQEKVLRAIRELDYHPNMLGKNLRNSSTGIIIVLANTISKPFFIEFFATIQKAAADNNYNILLGQYGDDEELLMNYVNMVLSRLADGLLLVNHNKYVPYLENICHKFPIVQVCERTPESDIPYVSEDWYECGYIGTEHLISSGRKNIGFINYNRSALFARKYYEGYAAAMKKAGLHMNPKWITEIDDMEMQTAYKAARQILSQEERPDSIYAVCDLYAPAVIKASKELGIRIPEDLSLVCGDNSFVADITAPSVTSLDHRRQTMADAAFDLLLKQINNSNSLLHNSVSISPQLIIREST